MNQMKELTELDNLKKKKRQKPYKKKQQEGTLKQKKF